MMTKKIKVLFEDFYFSDNKNNTHENISVKSFFSENKFKIKF